MRAARFLYGVNYLLHLLEVGVLDILSLRTFLLSLLLTTLICVTARLAGCTTLLIHLLRSSLPSGIEGCDGTVDGCNIARLMGTGRS